MNWTVLMWHFGADALTGYSGKRFCLSWKLAQDMLVRAYSKKTNGKKLRIMLERQECPRISLAEAIQEKLNVNLLIFSMNPGVWSKGSNPSPSVFFDLLHEINQK